MSYFYFIVEEASSVDNLTKAILLLSHGLLNFKSYKNTLASSLLQHHIVLRISVLLLGDTFLGLRGGVSSFVPRCVCGNLRSM